MAGFACSVKYTAVPVVLVGLPLCAALATAKSRLQPKQWVRGSIIFWIAGAATFSPWLIRNTSLAGNPLFPLAMRQLGKAHFTDEQVERFVHGVKASATHSAKVGRLDRAWHEIVADWRYGWILLPLAAGSAFLMVGRPPVAFLTAGAVAFTFFWLFFAQLMSRYFMPTIPLLAMLAGYFAITRWRTIIIALAVAAAAINFFGTPLVRSNEGITGLHRAFVSILTRGRVYEGGLFYMTDLNDLRKLAGVHEMNQKLALVGEAKAFYYPLPMSRLEYRTIWDVVIPPGSDIANGWLGRDIATLRKDHFVLLNPGELMRISREYNMPPPPAQWQSEVDEEIILPPQP
jgi:hypothetical protein